MTDRNDRNPTAQVGDISAKPSASVQPLMAELIELRLSRRAALKGLAAAAVAGFAPAEQTRAADKQAKDRPPTTLDFEEIRHACDDDMHVPAGYQARVLLRWGDAIFSDAADFNPLLQTAAAQEKQFGYNNDFVAFMPLTRNGARPSGNESAEDLSQRGLLCVNHEYTISYMMFPNIADRAAGLKQLSKEQVQVEMAATGHGIVEIVKTKAGWQPVKGSRSNRRLSALSTRMRVSGPAAGSERLKTSADRDGRTVIGTFNNCSGGVTPWGTVLSGEENFNNYFAAGLAGAPHPEQANYKRYDLHDEPEYAWHKYESRFDVAQELHEPNRFGWVVEIDPYDPQSVPVKRTALGRLKHEGATPTVNRDGRVVVYLGDDQRNDYLYKFVTKGVYQPNNREANRDLLDEGTLYVARFGDRTLRWLPLVHGQGKLTSQHGFDSQADIVIEARTAADLLQATPMDRPEDIEVSPRDGRVYVMLPNNSERKTPDAANPRKPNTHGHIVELIPPSKDGQPDHAAEEFTWDILLLAGNPTSKEQQAKYHPNVTEHGWLSCPDNAVFDPQGRLWIATDDAYATSKIADGLYVCETDAPARALTRHFFSAPKGAEVCGPAFTPDGTTLFLAVQHPGDKEEDEDSTFDHPSTRWPDFQDGMPPRPSVVAITRNGGGPIGGGAAIAVQS